jgi:hypothetical protein
MGLPIRLGPTNSNNSSRFWVFVNCHRLPNWVTTSTHSFTANSAVLALVSKCPFFFFRVRGVESQRSSGVDLVSLIGLHGRPPYLDLFPQSPFLAFYTSLYPFFFTVTSIIRTNSRLAIQSHLNA